jgi:hypothetical protein
MNPGSTPASHQASQAASRTGLFPLGAAATPAGPAPILTPKETLKSLVGGTYAANYVVTTSAIDTTGFERAPGMGGDGKLYFAHSEPNASGANTAIRQYDPATDLLLGIGTSQTSSTLHAYSWAWTDAANNRVYFRETYNSASDPHAFKFHNWETHLGGHLRTPSSPDFIPINGVGAAADGTVYVTPSSTKSGTGNNVRYARLVEGAFTITGSPEHLNDDAGTARAFNSRDYSAALLADDNDTLFWPSQNGNNPGYIRDNAYTRILKGAAHSAGKCRAIGLPDGDALLFATSNSVGLVRWNPGTEAFTQVLAPEYGFNCGLVTHEGMVALCKDGSEDLLDIFDPNTNTIVASIQLTDEGKWIASGLDGTLYIGLANKGMDIATPANPVERTPETALSPYFNPAQLY